MLKVPLVLSRRAEDARPGPWPRRTGWFDRGQLSAAETPLAAVVVAPRHPSGLSSSSTPGVTRFSGRA